jgi:hypothetical protein
MGLMTVLGALTLNYFVSSNLTATRTTDASLTTAQARTAMTAVNTLLRLADSPTAQAGYSTNRFDQITASQTTFYSNVNTNRAGSTARSAPDKIVLTASGTKLTEKLYAPKSATVPADYTQNYAATPTTTRVLVDNLASTSVFSYCAVFTSDASTCTTPAATGDSVAAVTVSISISGLRGETTQYFTSTIGITGALS